jgi:hypothetical protein
MIIIWKDTAVTCLMIRCFHGISLEKLKEIAITVAITWVMLYPGASWLEP